MKAVVTEIRGSYAAVLKKDGSVIKVPDRGYAVGQEIEVAERRSIHYVAFRTLTAAAAAVIVLSGGLMHYRTAYAASAYVTVDVNPSLEYALNAREEVLSVAALNTDGEAVAAAITESGVKGMTLTEALQLTQEVLTEQSYLDEDSEDYLLLSVACDNEERRGRLMEEAQAAVRPRGIGGGERPEDRIEIVGTSMQTREHARQMELSTGRYEMARELTGEPMDEGRMREYGARPVRELMERDGHGMPPGQEPPLRDF